MPSARAALGWVYYGFVRTLLAASSVFPPAVLRPVMSCVAFFEVTVSPPGRAAWRELRQTMGISRGRSLLIACAAARRQYEDLAELHRVRIGRSDPAEWTREETGCFAEVEACLDRGQPVVVALAHFGFAGLLPLLTKRPGIPAIAVVGETPAQPRGGKEHTAVLSQKCLMEAYMRARPDSLALVTSSAPNCGLQLLRFLRQNRPGVALVMADSYWYGPGGITRPFCSSNELTFAVGAARLARLSNATLFAMVHERTGARGSRLHWAGPFDPTHAKTDEEVTSDLLDWFEPLVGQFRPQYRGRVGLARSWDARTASWSALGSAPAAQVIETS